jgi:hypothetical protein
MRSKHDAMLEPAAMAIGCALFTRRGFDWILPAHRRGDGGAEGPRPSMVKASDAALCPQYPNVLMYSASFSMYLGILSSLPVKLTYLDDDVRERYATIKPAGLFG